MSTANTTPETESAPAEPADETLGKDEKLAIQVNELIMAGGTVGDTLNFTAEDYEALYVVGHGYYQQAQYQDAYRVFAYLVIHNHLELRFITAFASSLQMLQNWNEAIHYYSMVIAMDRANPQPMLHVCECLIGLERYTQAREGLSLVLALSQRIGMADLAQKAQALMELVGDKEDVPFEAAEASIA